MDLAAPAASRRLDAIAVAAAPLLCKAHLILGALKAQAALLYAGLAVGLAGGPGRSSPYPTIDPNIGFTSEALGRQAAEQVLSGRLPWWNPFEGVGAPLAGEMQSAALFPLTWLLALPDGQLWMHLALQMIAGLATWDLLRKLGAGRLAAAAGAVAFEFNGAFGWLANAAINPIAFLPVVLLGVEIVREQTGTRRSSGLAWIAVGVAASLYAGFPEVAYIDGLLAAAWTLARTGSLAPGRRLAFLVRVGAGVLIALALAAPVLVAFFDYLPLAHLGAHTAGAFADLHLPARYLPALFVPYAFGGIFHDAPYADFWANVGGYAGCGLVSLAIFGATGARERVLRMTLAAWVVVALAATYGAPGVSALVRAVPGLADAAFYRYAPASWSLALCVLAALGLSDLRTGVPRVRLAASAVATAALLAAAMALARAQGAYLGAGLGRPSFVAAVLVLASLIAVALTARRTGRLVPMLAAVLVAEGAAAFVLPTLSWPRAGHLDRDAIAFLQANAGLQRIATTGPLAPNYGSYFGLATINHNDLPIPKAWTDYVKRHLDAEADPVLFLGGSSIDDLAARPDAYRAVGVRYVLVPRDALATQPFAALAARTDIAGEPYRRVHRSETMDILELSAPAAYFQAPGCQLTPQSRERLLAHCAAPTQLVRLELSMPGWRATVDGREAPLRTTGEIFQAIDLPAGASSVTFAFEPPGVRWGFLALGAGVVALLADAVWRRRRSAAG